MPKIKRYWPCSHGLNRDPQFQELRRLYGDWMGFVWMELCAIGDLNNGEIKGTPAQIGASLAYISLKNRPSLSAISIANALQTMDKWRWIRVQTDRVLIVNYRKYHKTQTTKKFPPNIRTSEQPTEHKEQKPNGLALEIKTQADIIYRFDAKKFERLIVWVKQAQAGKWPDDSIALALERFQKYKAEVRDWWPYLDKILYKADKDLNVQRSLAEHERFKREVKETAELYMVKRG